MKRMALAVLVMSALASACVCSTSYALNSAATTDPLSIKIDPKTPLPDSHILIDRAKESVENNLPSAQMDINRLFLKLLRSKDIAEQYNLIDAIHDLGDLRYGNSSVAVKAYIQQMILIVLPKLPSSAQGFADTRWGHLFLSEDEMKGSIGVIAPESREKEQAGLKVLRARNLGVSYHTLQEAISNADVELTQALLLAGLRVDSSNILKTFEYVSTSLGSACRNPTLPADRINQTLYQLVANGYPMDYADSFGHTLLFSAAQVCSGPVIERILSFGAPAAPRDRKGITPLEMALESERFDAADVLMKHGARLSKSAGQRVLFFPNRDSRLDEYVKRATEPVKADSQ